MRQLDLFDVPPPSYLNPSVPGPCTNLDFAAAGFLKYTGRLSELRRDGYDVAVVEHDHRTGRVVYELRREP